MYIYVNSFNHAGNSNKKNVCFFKFIVAIGAAEMLILSA